MILAGAGGPPWATEKGGDANVAASMSSRTADAITTGDLHNPRSGRRAFDFVHTKLASRVWVSHQISKVSWLKPSICHNIADATVRRTTLVT